LRCSATACFQPVATAGLFVVMSDIPSLLAKMQWIPEVL
jgi:hypothetical protein